MARKLKKALKKAAKVALPMLAVAGLGKAFMNARNRKAMLDSATADDGFGFMKMKDFGPYSTKKGVVPVNMMTAKDMANDPMFINAETLMNDERMFKKGGRVKKGFSKKKKKQASRMRKK